MIRDLNVYEMDWQDHPFFKDLMVKKLLTNEKDGVDLTVVMVKVKKGSIIPEHVHEQDDIVYHLEGTCNMWVENEGVFTLKPGSFMRIPAGIKHQPQDINEDILVFDIYLPHLY